MGHPPLFFWGFPFIGSEHLLIEDSSFFFSQNVSGSFHRISDDLLIEGRRIFSWKIMRIRHKRSDNLLRKVKGSSHETYSCRRQNDLLTTHQRILSHQIRFSHIRSEDYTKIFILDQRIFWEIRCSSRRKSEDLLLEDQRIVSKNIRESSHGRHNLLTEDLIADQGIFSRKICYKKPEDFHLIIRYSLRTPDNILFEDQRILRQKNQRNFSQNINGFFFYWRSEYLLTEDGRIFS